MSIDLRAIEARAAAIDLSAPARHVGVAICKSQEDVPDMAAWIRRAAENLRLRALADEAMHGPCEGDKYLSGPCPCYRCEARRLVGEVVL